MRNVKSIVTAALALTVICAVVVAALAGTDLLTRDIIAEQTAAAAAQACKDVLPAADTFEEVSGTFAQGVLQVYKAKSGDTVCGYVIKTTTNGKSSGLEVMTGIAADGTVCGVAVVSNNETAGYVDTVTKKGLLEKLKGVSGNTAAVDAVSQATKTSNGIKQGVDLALQTFGEVTGNG